MSDSERNVISGNAGDGVLLEGVTQITFQGNYIGLNAAGDTAVGNLGNGVSLGNLTSGATIGGSAARNGNVISGNAGHGVWAGPYSSGNLIQGNFIGTDATGNAAVGNQLSGILLNGNGTIVGGLTSLPGRFAGNLISGNAQLGITTLGSDSTIQGNIIGLNLAGNSSLKNHFGGIGNAGGGSSQTQIGGTNPQARNVISGNGSEAEINLYGTDRWIVQGNFVGTDILGLSRIEGRDQWSRAE